MSNVDNVLKGRVTNIRCNGYMVSVKNAKSIIDGHKNDKAMFEKKVMKTTH